MKQTIKTTVRLTAKGRRVTATASGCGARVSWLFDEYYGPDHDYMDQHAAAARALLVRLKWHGVYVAGPIDGRGGVVWVNRDGVTVDGKPAPRDMRACSLCGRPAGVGDGSGAAWVLCADCEGTDAARAAGFTHDHEAAHDAD